LQVDLQIAEYELNKAKEKLKASKKIKDNDIDESDDDESTNSSSDQNGNNSSFKRKKSQSALSRAENYNEKKARFETTVESLTKYFKDPKENEKSLETGHSKKSNSSESDGIEEMIKNGEMTPFGTLIDFEKGKTLGKSKNESSSNKTSKVTSKATSSNLSEKKSNLTEFDSFFLDLDRQLVKSAKNKPKTSNSMIKDKASLKSNSKPNDQNTNSEALAKEKNSKQNESQPLPNFENSLKKDSNKKSSTSSYVESSLTDFDKFLIDLDKPKTSKQVEKEATTKTNLSKSTKTKNDFDNKNSNSKLKSIPKASNNKKDTTKSKIIFQTILGENF